jgi:hypothetical protein
MNRTVVAAVIVSGGFLALSAAPALAEHPHLGAPNEPVVPAHQHYVVTPNGNLPVGPNACEDGMSLAFDHFHLNVHRGVPGTQGTVVATGCPSP